MKNQNQHIVVIGSGAAGLSAAWLLNKQHRVTLVEMENRLGGHAHTATIENDNALKIDTGFIVYNEPSYPNLTQWFQQMGVNTEASDMSFAVSRDNGNFEYAGGPLLGLLAQPTLPLGLRFWSMLKDLLRFYRNAARDIPADSEMTLGEYLAKHRYSNAFIQDHLLPFGAAIWSTSKNKIEDYPAAAFIRFCENHGLLKISGRPQWRTVTGGSEQYVDSVRNSLGEDAVKTGFEVKRVVRNSEGVSVIDAGGHRIQADEVVFACHADQSLSCLETPTDEERALLSAFQYETNLAVLHTDITFMPKRKRAWCSWNYVEGSGFDSSRVCVSYWMNKLQNLKTQQQYIVTLNPSALPNNDQVFRAREYTHPVFTKETWKAQQSLWSLQGKQKTWYCGSYFGSGFHEDAIQSGLAVAEHLGGVARPWDVENPSGRIVISAQPSVAS